VFIGRPILPLASKLNILAGIGIRGLIEAVCNEQGMMGNLEQKINDLVANEILTKTNADILHEIRFMGNQSAHEFEIKKEQELHVGFAIIENLLRNLYEIPKMAESLKRKSAQGASK
jgi:DNA polymerase III alpha subunit (gram-positive type)